MSSSLFLVYLCGRVRAPPAGLAYALQNFQRLLGNDAAMTEKPSSKVKSVGFCLRVGTVQRFPAKTEMRRRRDPQSRAHARALSISVRSFTLIVLLVCTHVPAAERATPQVLSAGGCK